MKTKSFNPEQAAYNKAVTQVYFKMLKATKELLATVEDESLRYSLVREDRNIRTRKLTLNQFISPLLYIRVDFPNGEACIHYGYETLPVVSPYYEVTSSFIRMLYKFTMDNGASINIEKAIRVDWGLTNIGDCYEHLEEMGHKQHRFELIRYKPKQTKRKLQRVA